MLGRARTTPRSSVLVAAVVMALGFLLSVADPAAGAPQQASVAIFDDDADQAMFPGLTMAPGHSYTECVLVGATAAAIDDWVQLGVADVTGSLAQHLVLSVETGQGGRFGDCSTFTGSPIFTGTLADLAAAGTGYGVGTGWQPAQTSARSFRITVALDGGLRAQGLRAQGRFVWRLVGAAPAPTTPSSSRPRSTGPAAGPTSTDPTAPSGAAGATTAPPSPSVVVEPTPPPSGVAMGSPVPANPTVPSGGAGEPPSPDISIGAEIARFVKMVQQAQRAAVAVVASPEYPVSAIMIALLFLLVQDRIDRRDPKLAAVARQRDNEADFPDRFGVLTDRFGLLGERR